MKTIYSIVVILVAVFICGSCFITKFANDAANEKLRNRLLKGEFNKVIDEAYPAVKNSQPEENLRKLEELTIRLKAVDPEMKWERSSFRPDPSVGADDSNFSALDVIGNGQTLTVTINWMSSFQLCGIGVFEGPNDSGGGGFRICD